MALTSSAKKTQLRKKFTIYFVILAYYLKEVMQDTYFTKIMTKLDWSNIDAQDILGKSPRTICRYRSGDIVPDKSMIMFIELLKDNHMDKKCLEKLSKKADKILAMIK